MFQILSFLFVGLPILILSFQVLFALITSFIAVKKGRSGIGWFFIGLIIGFIGLIILLVIPDLKVESKKEEILREEINQLKEQLLMEQKRNDEFRRSVSMHIEKKTIS